MAGVKKDEMSLAKMPGVMPAVSWDIANTLVVLPARSSWILLCRICTNVDKVAAGIVLGTGSGEWVGETSEETGGKNDLVLEPPADVGSPGTPRGYWLLKK